MGLGRSNRENSEEHTAESERQITQNSESEHTQEDTESTPSEIVQRGDNLPSQIGEPKESDTEHPGQIPQSPEPETQGTAVLSQTENEENPPEPEPPAEEAPSIRKAGRLCDKVQQLLENTQEDEEKYTSIGGYVKFIQKMESLEDRQDNILSDLPNDAQGNQARQNLETKFSSLNDRKDNLANQMKTRFGSKAEEKAEELLDRKKNAEEYTKQLNDKYNEKTPIIRLIRKAKQIENVTGQAEEESKSSKFFQGVDKVGEFVDKHITGSATSIVDSSLSMTYDKKDRRNSTTSALGVLWDILIGKKSLNDALESPSKAGEMFGFFTPVLKVYLFLRHAHKYFKTEENSQEEKIEGIEGLTGESLDTLISGVSPVVEILGGEMGPWSAILGLINNAVSVLFGARAWKRAAKHRDEADKRKAELKQKMAEKRLKYAGQELKDENGNELFSFMGIKRKDGASDKIHIVKEADTGRDRITGGDTTLENQQESLESSWGQTDIYKKMKHLKKKKYKSGLSSEDKKNYYQMKAYMMIQEYKELKEAKYVNKKRIRGQVIGLVHTAVDITKNILKLVPGISSIAGSVLGIANTSSKYVHKGFTSLRQKGRDIGWWESEKSTTKKSEKRGKMAKNMFNQMIFAESFMNKEDEAQEKGTFQPLNGMTNTMLEKRMDYLSGLTDSLGYKFSSMHEAKNKEELLEKMASAFSMGG